MDKLPFFSKTALSPVTKIDGDKFFFLRILSDGEFPLGFQPVSAKILDKVVEEVQKGSILIYL